MTCHAHVTESASLLPSAFSLISLTAEHAHGVSCSPVGGGAAGGACPWRLLLAHWGGGATVGREEEEREDGGEEREDKEYI